MNRSWDFDAIAGFFAPDAVRDLSVWGLEIYRGEDAIRDALQTWWATWAEHHHNVEEVLDLDHGVLFVVIWEYGCLKGRDSRVEQRHGDVYEFAQGKVARITTGCRDLDEGRAAAAWLAESRG